MAENIDHTNLDQKLLFKYALRLMSLAEAKDFERHFTTCDNCAHKLGEVTHFFELLQHSINSASPAERSHQPEASNNSHQLSDKFTESKKIQYLLQNPADHNLDDLLAILISCFNGFQKLRKNIAAQMSSEIASEQIEQVALEILLALPKQVSKI